MRILLGLLVAGILGFASDIDSTASDLSLRNMDGKKVHLHDYRGKIVVLNFWATWCGPCRHEMPMIADAVRTWGQKGVLFVAVSLDDKRSQREIPAFLQQAHADFPVWVGASANDLSRLQLGDGVPDTLFLNEQGIIVARVLGEMRRGELEERLAWLTSDRSGPPPQAMVNHMPSHDQ